MKTNIARYIERKLITESEKGVPFLAGHRITIADVAVWHHSGRSPEAIASDYDLKLVEVYAALAFYYDNKPEIDGYIQEDEAFFNAERVAQQANPQFQERHKRLEVARLQLQKRKQEKIRV